MSERRIVAVLRQTGRAIPSTGLASCSRKLPACPRSKAAAPQPETCSHNSTPMTQSPQQDTIPPRLPRLSRATVATDICVGAQQHEDRRMVRVPPSQLRSTAQEGHRFSVTHRYQPVRWTPCRPPLSSSITFTGRPATWPPHRPVQWGFKSRDVSTGRTSC